MAKGKSKILKVIYAPGAKAQLDEIWQWNADHYDPEHADEYVEFLQGEINGLASGRKFGRPVGRIAPGQDYLLMRRKAGRHGHIAVFQITQARVEVSHIFHTAQNWKKTLANDPD